MSKIKIIKRHQSFSVTPLDMDFMDFLEDMESVLKEFSLYRLIKDPRTKRLKTEIEKTFFLIDSRKNEIVLINTYLEKFINIFKNKYTFVFEDDTYTRSKRLKDIEINKEFIPREYQKLYIDAIVKNKVPRILVDLYTGYGKSLIATIASVKRKKKFALLILPRYINKWIDDLKKYTNISEENIFIVKGSDSIRYLSLASKEELDKIKVYIFSLTTMREYVSNYLDVNEEFKYPLEPREFIRRIGIESIVSDETHQEFHNIYSLTMILDPIFMLALTATLIGNTKREKVIQDYFLPSNYRLSGIVEYKKYIELYPISYSVGNPRNLKSENMYGYNHGRFELSIKKRKQILGNYLDMIYFTVGKFYLKNREEDDKCLIFAYTVDMCEVVRDYLKSKIPDLKINKYTAEDDYSIIEKSDIIVSTLGSAGTALDIRNLTTVIQTVLIKSATSNIQALGRLRRLENKKVKFVYLYADNLNKHKDYHKERLNLFRDRVKSIINLNYTKTI